MDYPADYHMHTPLCNHAVGLPIDYAKQALSVGLKEIGFSEHSPMPRDDFDDWRITRSQLDEYVELVQQARTKYPQLTIRLALEVDFLPGYEDWIVELSELHDWDYFIGSVHYVSESWDIDNPKKIQQWRERDPMEVWTVYFERLAQAAASGLFDIIGHADLCKKFCFYPEADCTGLYKNFLKEAQKTDTAIEINTAGLRKECKEMYPNQVLLKMARDHDVKLTFGSDSHAPEEVGMNFKEAIEWAKKAGYSESLVFDHREKKPLKF